ncbi:MAG TPA: porin [Gammaproteobacteria bacterium]|nr:porin [Gammaproteobacteria bacterium]HRP88168.1 porin [Gammaproteobacteria bacterium]
MKKTMLAIAIGATCFASAAASAAPTVYGRFNVALDSQKDEIGLDFGTSDSTIKLRDNNNSSRLGVKGKEDLGVGGLGIVYQMEYGIDPDGSESNPFSKRNLFVGLEGGFGQLKAGFYDTIIKDIGGPVDQFNDTVGDITNLMVGETRTSNLITYTSPKVGEAVRFVVTLQPGEGRVAADDISDVEKSIADSWYAAMLYDGKMFSGAVAYGSNQRSGMKFDGPTVGSDILRFTGKVKLDAFEIGALYQMAEGIDQTGGVAGSDAQEDSWLLSGAYSINSWKLKAQYGQTDGDLSGAKRTQMAVGADYKLSKATTTQLYYVTYEDKDRVVGGITDPKTDTFGVAFIYSF